MERIEVVTLEEDSTKVKGDLLESFASELMKTQNYKVTEEIRVTASELDLLCESEINGRKIYVECKAYRDNLSADIPKKLLGTVILQDYSEGWLISTGQLGKDAKGFVDQWSNKKPAEREKLSFILPDKIITTFSNSGIIIPHTEIRNDLLSKLKNKTGNWTLILSPFGKFWIVECLEGGLPVGLLVFHASDGTLVEEIKLLSNLSRAESSFSDLDFQYFQKLYSSSQENALTVIVPVQHGESWDDYRPARPTDFVGRETAQKDIIHFFESVNEKKSITRVFAITGNSGMGKSSLIAKLRKRVRNKSYKKKFYIYAVDVRAAKDQSYINYSIIKSIKKAQDDGFLNKSEVKITDHTNPFNSESLINVLKQLRDEEKVFSLVFDQFEELYSRPELFPIFEKVKDLLLNVTSLQENFVLGFAWKTDSTVYQDHPAYYFWHDLRDIRYTISLSPFSKGDSEKVISKFEKQINDKIPKNLRHQLVNHAQGYPWLLKKLCIHIYHKLQESNSIDDLLNENLDIKNLFDKDLQELSPPEKACINLVAQKAPVDWFEIAELTDSEILKQLIEKRLVLRSGERLIIYWDIFREYLLTGKVPVLPFNYLPVSPSFKTFIAAAETLDSETSISYKGIAKEIKVSEGTAQNIVSDILMLRLGKGKHDALLLDDSVESSSLIDMVIYLRNVFTSHVVVQEIRRMKQNTVISQNDLTVILKEHNPLAQYSNQTWRLYSNRIGIWLSNMGFITPQGKEWIYKEREITEELIKDSSRRSKGSGYGFTLYNTSPEKVAEAFAIIDKEEKSSEWLKEQGYRNATFILKRLGIVSIANGMCFINDEYKDSTNHIEIMKNLVRKEKAFKVLEELSKSDTDLDSINLANILDNKYEMNWSEGSLKRVGYSLLSWWNWLNATEQDFELEFPMS